MTDSKVSAERVRDEFTKLLNGADETFNPVLMFMRYTPARPGVVRELRCEDVDAD